MSTSFSLFSELPDPRAANARHSLSSLLVIAIAATLCGAQTCVDFAQFAKSKKALLSRLVDYDEPPSHDTFSRLFRLLDPTAFAAQFARFTAAFGEACQGVVALDGKAMRRAYEAGRVAAPPLTVTAWAAGARLTLAAQGVGPGGGRKARPRPPCG